MAPDIDAVMEEYADWMRSWGASRNTIDARVGVLTPKVREWGGVAGVTTRNIRTWLAGIAPEKTATRVTYHAHSKSLCDYLVAVGHLPTHPMEGQIRSPRRPTAIPHPLSEAEAAKVLVAASGDVRAWLILAMCAGLRAHEIAKIRGEDVTEDGIFVRGKGGVEAVLPTHPDVWDIAQRYPRTGWWFPADTPEGHVPRTTISKRVGDLFRSCGVRPGSIHRARHLYATRLLRQGVNIRIVQQLMRHSNVKTTAGYTAVDEDELRAAILRLPHSA